jgi:hypothetical protein
MSEGRQFLRSVWKRLKIKNKWLTFKNFKQMIKDGKLKIKGKRDVQQKEKT